MDAQGGGNAIKDLLAEGYGNKTPILDMDNDDTKYRAGRRILKLINFSPSWIADANFGALSLFENNRLRFPDVPMTVFHSGDFVTAFCRNKHEEEIRRLFEVE